MAGEIVAYTQFMTSRRQSENLGTTVTAAMANPVIGPVLVVGAAYFGVPPEYVAALAAAAAEAQQVKAEQNRQHSGDRDTFTFSAPDGYKLCATRVAAISIHPTKRNRPKAIISGSTKSIVAYVDHSSQEWNAGRSTVKLRFDMLAVKSEAFEKYAPRCLKEKVETLIPLCRGRDCVPAMNGSTWYNGQ
jgi:uncharacterized protein (DUF2147 family)